MFFRERGRLVQLLRSQYDPNMKRSRQEIVGTIPRTTLEVPEDVAARLTEGERDELRAYIEQTRTLSVLRTKLAAHDLPRVVAEAVQYAAQVTDPIERDQLRHNFADAIVALRRASTRTLSGPEVIDSAA